MLYKWNDTLGPFRIGFFNPTNFPGDSFNLCVPTVYFFINDMDLPGLSLHPVSSLDYYKKL